MKIAVTQSNQVSMLSSVFNTARSLLPFGSNLWGKLSNGYYSNLWVRSVMVNRANSSVKQAAYNKLVNHRVKPTVFHWTQHCVLRRLQERYVQGQ